MDPEEAAPETPEAETVETPVPEPVAEAEPEPEPTEEGAPSPPPESEVPQFVEQLFDTDPEKQPGWVKALDAILERDGLESFKGVSAADITDPVAQQLVHNLRGLTTRVTQTVAEERLQLQQQRAAVEEKAEKLEEERANLLAIFKDPRLAAAMKLDAPEAPLDPLSPEGIAHQAKEAGSKWFEEVFGVLGNVSEEMQQAAEARRGEVQRQAAITELGQFRDAHPDFDNYWDDIKGYVQKHNMLAQDAYLLLKAKDGTLVPEPPKPTAKEVRKVRSASASVLGRGGRVPTAPEAPTDPGALIEWLREDPERARAHYAKSFGRSNGYA